MKGDLGWGGGRSCVEVGGASSHKVCFLCSSPRPQLVFASICRSFWECGLVALDDITVTLGDCKITAGNHGLGSHGKVRGTL